MTADLLSRKIMSSYAPWLQEPPGAIVVTGATMAISDVLSESRALILGYLQDTRAYPPGDPLTMRIKALTDEMEAIRAILDAPPAGS